MESRPIPTGPLVVSSSASYKIVEEVREALLSLDPSRPEHRKVLERLDDEFKNGFMLATDSDYADIRSLINSVPETCGRGCHPRIRL